MKYLLKKLRVAQIHTFIYIANYATNTWIFSTKRTAKANRMMATGATTTRIRSTRKKTLTKILFASFATCTNLTISYWEFLFW